MIKPAALSTSLVMDIVGSCVDSVTLTVAVESVDVRISKPVPAPELTDPLRNQT